MVQINIYIHVYLVCPLCLAPDIAKRKIERIPPITNTPQQDTNHDSTMSLSSDTNRAILEVEIPVFNGITSRQEPLFNEISQAQDSPSRPQGQNIPQQQETSSPRASSTRLVQGITGHRNPAS